jgi:hypothetical protein
MSDEMRLSMVMIARNEQANVRACFDSFWPYVDEVVLCDTGSMDGTVGEARRYAQERDDADKLVVGHFKWCYDFGAARTHAHSLASGDVHTWIDLDDRLEGAEHMHAIVEQFAKRPQLGMIMAQYHLGSEWNVPVDRFARAPVRWVHPTYERIAPRHMDRVASTGAVLWRHTGDSQHGRRDLDIALRWAEEAPENWLPWFAAAKEAMFPLGDYKLAMRYAYRALECDTAGGREAPQHAFLYEVMMTIAFNLGDAELAEIFARHAVAISASPRACLLLARESLLRGEYDEVEDWAAEAKRAAPRHQMVTDLAEDLAAVAVRRRREVALAVIRSGVPLLGTFPAVFGA